VKEIDRGALADILKQAVTKPPFTAQNCTGFEVLSRPVRQNGQENSAK
jgi:hypothetical protein